MKRTLLFLGIALALIAAGTLAYRIRMKPASATTAVTDHAHESGAPATSPTTQRGSVTIDARRQQLIGVRTVAARRTQMTPTIRAVGTVRAAETRLADVNLKLDGWIRDLFVDYTGQPITKGQPLFALYSPDLLATENEYLLALKTRDQLQASQVADARERADQLVASARQRLALWDLPDADLRALDEDRRTHDTVTFRSPVSGVVMEKMAVQGMHVTAGQTLYKIADLSVVWVEADVYEREVSLVHVGGAATVTLDAYPGERFVGRVVYIYPYVDDTTRTNKVRYEFPNPRGRLKPGMFANVEMATPAGAAIVVPLNALLDSGQEQIVFVSQGDGYFEPRKVKAGRRLGDDVQILEGVKEGELVATGASFFLDSESQLRAAVQGYKATAGNSPPPTPSSSQLDIAFRTTPDPPKTGDNQMEVAVKDAAGKPVDGADVSVQFFMPAMPTMNMPSMQSETKLAAAGNGVYRGPGQVLTAGQWQVTVTVTRGGQRLGATQLVVVTR
ncbi:MAG TPA: FixH family protein [Vicinamibacterales bacterium]|nr:FixH family protein [Vicinamibacterales bacterium]